VSLKWQQTLQHTVDKLYSDCFIRKPEKTHCKKCLELLKERTAFELLNTQGTISYSFPRIGFSVWREQCLPYRLLLCCLWSKLLARVPVGFVLIDRRHCLIPQRAEKSRSTTFFYSWGNTGILNLFVLNNTD